MPGHGHFPFGLLPLGTGAQATATVPPERRPQQARFINPVTRDYERDTDGEFKRMPITRQRVLIALSSKLSSGSAVPWLGVDIPQRMDITFERRVQIRVREALRHLTRDGSLRIISIKPRIVQVGRVEIKVHYFDNLIDADDTVTV